MPATAMRIVSLAPSTLPDDLVPEMVNVAAAKPATAARFRNSRRLWRDMGILSVVEVQ